MYEHRNEPIIPRKQFHRRMAGHILAALGLLLGSILLGAVGFVIIGDVHWSVGALHATTLVSGLGMAEIPETWTAKLFAGLFALYSGFLFVAMSGIIIAPIAHRILHYFHWEERDS